MLGKENIILDTSNPHRDSKPARTRMERHGAVSSRISSPGSQARSHMIVSSKYLTPTSMTILGRWKTLFRFKLSSEIHIRSRTRVSP